MIRQKMKQRQKAPVKEDEGSCKREELKKHEEDK